MALVLLISVAVLLFLTYVGMSKRYSRNSVPCPRSYPVVGHMPILLALNYKKFVEIGHQLGTGIYSLHLWNKDFVIVNSWNVMKEVLHLEVFAGRPHTTFSERMLKYSLILWDGPMWKEKKRFTLHHFRNLGFGKSRMEQVIHDEICKIMKAMDEHDGKKVTMSDLFFMMFLNVIWGVVAGKTFEYKDKQMKQLHSILKKDHECAKQSMPVILFPLLQYIPGDPFAIKLGIDQSEKLFKFFNESIEEHVKDGTEQPQDYIGFYLAEISKRKDQKSDSDKCYTRRHLLGSLYDILHGGIETTQATMEWALIYTCLWPEIQKKVQDELDRVIGSNRLPAFADQANLPYTRATIREIQRFCTVIPMGAPRQIHATAKLMGYTIPAESYVLLNYWAINNEKETWGDPEVFRPERFLDENGKTAGKLEHFIPFSQGGRACIGESLAQMEVFLSFTCLMQRYAFSYPPGEVPPSLTPQVSSLNSPLPFHFVIKRR